MSAILIREAAEKLAQGVERAKPGDLGEIHAELFPEASPPTAPAAADLARHVRAGLAAEELVDLWNVVFPADRHVWYDEEAQVIRYNEELVEYAD